MEMAFKGTAASKGDPYLTLCNTNCFSAGSRALTHPGPVSRLLPVAVLKMSGWSWGGAATLHSLAA